MEATLNQIGGMIGQNVPGLLGAIAVLLVGWLAAWVIAALMHGALKRASFDNRLAEWMRQDGGAAPLPIERWISRGVFYLLMIFVLIGFFQALGLTAPTEPLNRLLTTITSFLPQILGAFVLLLVAWVLAQVLHRVVGALLRAVRVDEKLAPQVGDGEKPIYLTQTLANTAYWLVFLLFLPAILSALSLQGLLQPVQAMLGKILAYLPNLFSAGLIFVIGWLVARIVQGVASNLLAAMGVDRVGERAGLTAVMGQQRLSSVIGLVLYVLILIPVLIAGLDALAFDAVTRPASNMLNTLFDALPRLFAAGLIITIAYIVGRIIAGLTTNLLTGVGFNSVLSHVGVSTQARPGDNTPSEMAGNLVLVAILLFAAIEAVRELGMETLSGLIARFTVFGGEIILGLAIFGIGLFLANLAARTINASGAAQSWLLSLAARCSIIVLAGAMALRQMGLAPDIINLAFGLLLGSVAVAVALAFGLGARDVAGQEIAEWRQSLRQTHGNGREENARQIN